MMKILTGGVVAVAMAGNASDAAAAKAPNRRVGFSVMDFMGMGFPAECGGSES
jgi:hypothetical protein